MRYARKVTNIPQPTLSAHISTLFWNLRPPHPGHAPHFKSSVTPTQRHLRHRIISPPLGSCSLHLSLGPSLLVRAFDSNRPAVPEPWHKGAIRHRCKQVASLLYL